MAPSLKISLSSAGQKHAPCRLEISTRRREDFSRVGLNLSWPAAGIEAATPFPRINSLCRVWIGVGHGQATAADSKFLSVHLWGK
jgi:hypothetical protein